MRSVSKRSLFCLATGCLSIVLLFTSGYFSRATAQKPLADEGDLAKRLKRIPATSPQESLKGFKLEQGFQLELVASEPDVMDPVDACFDENGQLFVAEMRGYPYLPDQVPDYFDRPVRKNAGVIRLLKDTTGDGKMDKSIVFADTITWPTSVCCYDGGVYVIAPPNIYYFKDTDGEVHEIMQTFHMAFNLICQFSILPGTMCHNFGTSLIQDFHQMSNGPFMISSKLATIQQEHTFVIYHNCFFFCYRQDFSPGII